MISQAAILVWIILGASLFVFTSPTRAFILVYTIGILALPVEKSLANQGVIAFTLSLRIDKFVACNLAVLIGTIAFAPQMLQRFRLGLIDAVFGLLLLGAIATSYVNGNGFKDGISTGTLYLLGYYPAMAFARMYITNLAELNVVLRALIGSAVIYGVICIAEARLSPQLHRIVYGYFQHSFGQFMRYGWFRPAGMLRHAIEVSFFMGSISVLATCLVAKKMFPPLWGIIPGWAVVSWLLLALLLTFSVSGYVAFVAGISVFLALQLTQKRAVLLALPIISLTWMLLRYFGEIDTSMITNFVARFNVERAESLAYRLHAESVYLFDGDLNPIVGGSTDIYSKGKPAVDAFWLINLGFYGWLGLGCWLLLWASGIIALYRWWPRLGKIERLFCAIPCVAIAPMFLDFLVNSFPSHLLMIMTMGLATVTHRLATSQKGHPVLNTSPVMIEKNYRVKPLSHIATRPIL